MDVITQNRRYHIGLFNDATPVRQRVALSILMWWGSNDKFETNLCRVAANASIIYIPSNSLKLDEALPEWQWTELSSNQVIAWSRAYLGEISIKMQNFKKQNDLKMLYAKCRPFYSDPSVSKIRCTRSRLVAMLLSICLLSGKTYRKISWSLESSRSVFTIF